MHLSEVIDLTGCDLGRVSTHSPDVPDNFQDVSDNENCEHAGIFYLVVSREEVFARITFNLDF